MDRAQSDSLMDRIEAGFDVHGFGLWCVELDGVSIGFTGLSVPWFRDGVEVGWRIRSAWWGHGYAPEAARAALAVAFDEIGLDEVISFTAATNLNSQRVMQKIGMIRDPSGDFDHPSVAAGNPLRAHVLYRLTAAQYRSTP
jgi:ribosomal-protein-alanine N-acetyltransferase